MAGAAWGWWRKSYVADYLVLLALLAALLVLMYAVKPRVRFRPLKDPELTYPLLEAETVPTWALLILAGALPLVLGVLVALLSHKWVAYRFNAWHEVHSFVLGFLFCVFACLVVTAGMKLVGRYRPDYDARLLSKNPQVIADGSVSFPSGHSSLSFAGLGFLVWFLAGKLHMFSEPRLWKTAAYVPFGLALFITLSRVMDYWHDFTDISVGAVLGFVISIVSYPMVFHSPFSARSGEPLLRDASKEAYAAESAIIDEADDGISFV